MIRKAGFALALAALLALPGVAMTKPTKQDAKAASTECHIAYDGDAATTDDNVKRSMNITIESATYKNFGDCVSDRAREEAMERKSALRTAREACQEETGKDRRACVRSEKAEVKAKKDAKDEARLEAANTCANEKTDDPDAFAENYGGTKKGAFRRCVRENTE